MRGFMVDAIVRVFAERMRWGNLRVICPLRAGTGDRRSRGGADLEPLRAGAAEALRLIRARGEARGREA